MQLKIPSLLMLTRPIRLPKKLLARRLQPKIMNECADDADHSSSKTQPPPQTAT